MVEEPPAPICRHTPGAYRICVQGVLDPHWSDYFAGLTILPSPDPAHPIVTTLVGTVRDQAALLGVLNHLHDLGLPLLTVERL